MAVDGEETYFGIVDATSSHYVLEVDEDTDAGLNVKTTSGPIQFHTTQEAAAPRKEGCSCLFGNPCMDSEVCEDWHNRFEVAKRNGWKGF
mmetsp:Transcript_25620/g.78816  ORF Transcript_25620/g.78816 Transcript_25620/m.78816 type:complete len:90 (+) Transcript_25620:268-537(+)